MPWHFDLHAIKKLLETVLKSIQNEEIQWMSLQSSIAFISIFVLLIIFFLFFLLLGKVNSGRGGTKRQPLPMDTSDPGTDEDNIGVGERTLLEERMQPPIVEDGINSTRDTIRKRFSAAVPDADVAHHCKRKVKLAPTEIDATNGDEAVVPKPVLPPLIGTVAPGIFSGPQLARHTYVRDKRTRQRAQRLQTLCANTEWLIPGANIREPDYSASCSVNCHPLELPAMKLGTRSGSVTQEYTGNLHQETPRSTAAANIIRPARLSVFETLTAASHLLSNELPENNGSDEDGE